MIGYDISSVSVGYKDLPYWHCMGPEGPRDYLHLLALVIVSLFSMATATPDIGF